MWVEVFLVALVWSVVVVGIALSFEKRIERASERQGLWRGALFLIGVPVFAAILLAFGVSWPVNTLPLWEETGAGSATGFVLEGGEAHPSLTAALALPAGWMTGLLVAWCGLVWGLVTIRAVVGHVRLWFVLKSARSYDGDVLVSERTASAMTVGWFRPRVLLPTDWLSRMDGTTTGMIVAHERTHIRRGDPVWRPVERAISDLMAVLPPVWIVRNRLDRERELACDAETVAVTRSPKAYARALLAAGQLPHRDWILAASPFPSKRRNEMAERIETVLRAEPARRARGLLASLAVIGLAVSPLAVAEVLQTEEKADGIAFVSPVIAAQDARLTSGFGVRMNPFTKQQAWHAGVDIGAELGTAIRTPADGVVEFAGTKPGYGNMVDVRLSGDTVVRFAQLQSIAVEKGEVLTAGTVVGALGESGRATGPHLHFELLVDGRGVDPEQQSGLKLIEKD